MSELSYPTSFASDIPKGINRSVFDTPKIAAISNNYKN